MNDDKKEVKTREEKLIDVFRRIMKEHRVNCKALVCDYCGRGYGWPNRAPFRKKPNGQH